MNMHIDQAGNYRQAIGIENFRSRTTFQVTTLIGDKAIITYQYIALLQKRAISIKDFSAFNQQQFQHLPVADKVKPYVQLRRCGLAPG